MKERIANLDEKIALVTQLLIPANKALAKAHELNKGIIGQYNGKFPLSVASVDHVYFDELSNKFYKCFKDYNGSELTKPDINYFKELSLVNINNELNKNESKKYGVKFSGSNPVGIRTYAAVGMVANVGVDEEEVQNDFDNISFYNRPVCCGTFNENGDFLVNAYEGEPGFARDGSNGDVYYECTPFYWNGSFEEPVVSAVEFAGSQLAPMFTSPDKKVYLPCYWASLTSDGKYRSISGTFPVFSSINGHMDSCRKTNANAHTETIKAHMSEYVLQLVEFATKDLQSVMMGACCLPFDWGNKKHVTTSATTNQNYIIMSKEKAKDFVVGQTIVVYDSWDLRRVITKIENQEDTNAKIYFEDQETLTVESGQEIGSFPFKTGATDNVKASSGSVISNKDGKHQCKWRGKEAPWADGFSGLCDILKIIDNEKHYAYLLTDPKKYKGSLTEDYVKLDYEISSTEGWAKNLGIDKKDRCAAITCEIGASSNTYLSAYLWNNNTTPAVAFVGGYWDIGLRCSPVSFFLSGSPSGFFVSGLARLLVTPV